MVTRTAICSEGLYRILGRDPELPDPTVDDIVASYFAGERETLERTIGQAIQTGEPTELHLTLTRDDGERRFVEVRSEAVKDDHGRVVRVWGTLHDATERKEADQAIRLAADRAETLVRIAGSLNAQLDGDRLLGAICEAVRDALAVPVAAIYLRGEDGLTLAPVRSVGLPAHIVERLPALPVAV